MPADMVFLCLREKRQNGNRLEFTIRVGNCSNFQHHQIVKIHKRKPTVMASKLMAVLNHDITLVDLHFSLQNVCQFAKCISYYPQDCSRDIVSKSFNATVATNLWYTCHLNSQDSGRNFMDAIIDKINIIFIVKNFNFFFFALN